MTSAPFLCKEFRVGFDVTDRTGTQFLPNSYGSQFADFDDDGDLDLYMMGAHGNPNELWRNEGDGTFAHVHDIVQDEVLYQSSTTLSLGGQAADYDNDGDLDLLFQDQAGPIGRMLFRNDGDWLFTHASTNGNQWLYHRLKGTEKKTSGIGAQVYATIQQGTPRERTLRRDTFLMVGTFHQDDLPVHIGLRAAEVVDELRIVWPNGVTQVLTNVSAGQYLEVTIPPSETVSGDVRSYSIRKEGGSPPGPFK